MSARLEITRRLFTRRAFAVATVVVLSTATAGCFDHEPEQRRAFITFLKERIINLPGLHIPILTKQEIADLGPYADQYRIMSRFHHQLNAVVSGDLKRALTAGTPRSIETLVGMHSVFPVVKASMPKIEKAVDDAEKEADAARKALKQPADLKAVYDVAFERMVGKPARVLRALLPKVDEMLTPVGELAEYLHSHQDVVSVSGNTITPKNEVVRQEVNGLMVAAARASRAALDGKKELTALMRGR